MPRLDHFGLLAPFYDRIFAGPGSGRLAELLDLPARRILDAGGGTGRIAGTLASHADLVVITDLSRGMLGQARTRASLKPALGRVERLPFPDGAFDRVLVVDAFHHFSDHRLAATELVRVLAPGGRLVVQEMNFDRFGVKLVALGERLLLMGSHFYRPEGLCVLFEGPDVRVTSEVDASIDLFVVVEKRHA